MFVDSVFSRYYLRKVYPDYESFHVTSIGHAIEGVALMKGTPNFPFHEDNRWVREASRDGMRIIRFSGGKCMWSSDSLHILGELYVGEFIDETRMNVKGPYTVYILCELESIVPRNVKGVLTVDEIPRIRYAVNPRMDQTLSPGKRLICIKNTQPRDRLQYLLNQADYLVIYSATFATSNRIVLITLTQSIVKARFNARYFLYIDCYLRAKTNGFEWVVSLGDHDTVKWDNGYNLTLKEPRLVPGILHIDPLHTFIK